MKEIQIFKTELDTLIDKLIGEEVTSRKNIKLSKLNDICKSIVNKGAVPTIQGVVKIMNEEGFVISARTIYNVRENGNAYRELLDGWIKYAAALKSKSSKPAAKKDYQPQNDILQDSDLVKIGDLVVRHRIALMIGELTSLRNQLNMLRQIKNLPPVSSVTKVEQGGGLSLQQSFLNEYEVEIIDSFLNKSSINRVDFDENGTLIASNMIKRGDTLSQPGLKEVLQKVVKSQRPML
jgi:hypothetical protein